MRRYTFFLLTLLTLPLCAQDTWTRTYDPFYEYSMISHSYFEEDILYCADGGYATNGYFLAESNEHNWLFGYLIKFDAAGDIEWAKRDSIPGLTGATESTCFTQTNDGGFFSVARNAYSSGYGYVKRDADGEIEWTQTSFPYFPRTMVSLADGSVVCAGYYYDTEVEAFGITKLTPDLQFEWGNHFLYRGMLGALEAMCVSNYPESEAGFLALGKVLETRQLFVVKTDAAGDTLWTRELYIGFRDALNKVYDVCEAPNGDVYVSHIWYDSVITKYATITQYSPDGELLDTFVLPSTTGEIGALGCLEYDAERDILVGVGVTNGQYRLAMAGISDMQEIEWTTDLQTCCMVYGDRFFMSHPQGGYIVAATYGRTTLMLLRVNDYGEVPVQDTESPSAQTCLTNYPNPFNPVTTIQFHLEEPSQVRLEIFNIRGQRVASLLNEPCSTGTHTVTWSAPECASGIYFAKMQTETMTETTKLLLLK